MTLLILIGTPILSSHMAVAAPVIEYPRHPARIDLTDRPMALFMKGDDLRYRLPDFDDSQWEVVSLPHNWIETYPDYTGICWYRIHLKFPETLPLKTVGISLGSITDADEYYFNGVLVDRTGRFPPDRKPAYGRPRLYEIPGHLIRPGGDNVIALRIAGLLSDGNGPERGRFAIDHILKLQRNFLGKEFFDVFFIVIYIAVSIYFLLLFIKHKSEKEYLHFALFCSGTGLYLFLRTEARFFISDAFLAMKQMEYFTLFLVFPLLMEFITRHFEKRHTLLHWIYYGTTLFCLVTITIYPNHVVRNFVLNNIVQPSWFIPVGYYLFIMIRESRRDSDAKYLLGTMFILLLTAVNDILVHRRVYDFIRITNYGFIFLIMGMAIIMRNRYAGMFQERSDIRKKGSTKRELTSFSKEMAEEAIAIISEKFLGDISRESVADELAINPDHLGKVFKQFTGTRISDYINRLRAEHAARLIRETDDGITQIAFSSGFESMSTFYRTFQKERVFPPRSIGN